jgi:prolyl oligopeptidase
MDNWTGGVSWLADSSGFVFSALEGDAIDFDQRIFLHRRGDDPTTTRVDVPSMADDYRQVVVSRDGRHAVLVERLMNPIPIAVADLDRPGEFRWRPFVTTAAGTVAGHLVGDAYIAVVTDTDAPRGRVVAIPLDSETPNDPSSWRELVPESETVIRSVTPVGDRLFLTEFVDTYARVRIVDLDGGALGEVPLPGRGAIAELPYAFMNLNVRLHPEDFLFNFSSLTRSWGTYRYRPGTGEVETLSAPHAVLEDAAVEDRWAVSADGTGVPYHLVHRRDVDVSVPQPAMIYGYGGLNAPWVPQFPGPMAAFVAAGGVFVHAHLRGGAELGLEWWESGRLQNKQNVFTDLYAIAEDLIASGVSSRDKLAVTGASNGGLLSGVAITQRPDLWKVAVPRVPILDLVGACRDGYGRMIVNWEFSDPSRPDGVRHLASFSPYQLVQDGTTYPAVFLDAGQTDPRCPPWHARKFGAWLQAATRGDAPVLIRIWENTGHGWATDKEIALVQNTEWLAFVMRHLELSPAGD